MEPCFCELPSSKILYSRWCSLHSQLCPLLCLHLSSSNTVVPFNCFLQLSHLTYHINLCTPCAVTYLFSRRVWVLVAPYPLSPRLFPYQFCLGGSTRHLRGFHCRSTVFNSEASAHHYGKDTEHYLGYGPTSSLHHSSCTNYHTNCHNLFGHPGYSTLGHQCSLGPFKSPTVAPGNAQASLALLK